MDMTNHSKLIYVVLEKLGAVNKETKVHSYTILNYIIEEGESLQEHELLKDIDEEEYVNMTLDISIKGISSSMNALIKRDLVEKTEPTNIRVEGITRNLRHYYLKK